LAIPETFARIGKVELKNIQRPLEVYRIILEPKNKEAAAGNREASKFDSTDEPKRKVMPDGRAAHE
jgi:hypothetical protein